MRPALRTELVHVHLPTTFILGGRSDVAGMEADTRIETVRDLVGLLGEVLKLGDSTLNDGSILAQDLDSAVAMDGILLHLATIRFDLQSHRISETIASANPGDLEHVSICLQKVKNTVSCLTDDHPVSYVKKAPGLPSASGLRD
jgi:hypothetical protein